LIGERLIEQLLAEAVAREQFQPQDISDKGIGGRHLGKCLGLLALRTEILNQPLPQLGMGLGLGHVEVEREVLTDLGSVGGSLQLAVDALSVVGKEARLEGLPTNRFADALGILGKL